MAGRLRGAAPTSGKPVAALVLTAVQCLVVVGVMLGAYALLPSGREDTTELLVRTLGALLLVVIVIALQLRGVLRSDRPLLRAARALTTVVTLFLLVFASIYAGLAHNEPQSFSAPLTRVDALYFTVTVFATVGFGDITPVTESARILVTVQMVLNLLLLGAGLRVLTGAARMRLESQKQQQG